MGWLKATALKEKHASCDRDEGLEAPASLESDTLDPILHTCKHAITKQAILPAHFMQNTKISECFTNLPHWQAC